MFWILNVSCQGAATLFITVAQDVNVKTPAEDALSCKVPVPVDDLAVHLSHLLHSFTQHPLLATLEIG